MLTSSFLPPPQFTPDFAYVMGGVGSERFKRFEQLCAQAFNILRKEADLFINLFALVSSSKLTPLPTKTSFSSRNWLCCFDPVVSLQNNV